MLINPQFPKLPESYLFSNIAAKVSAFKQSHPKANVISLGIGDVTRPLTPTVIEALHRAVDEMASAKTFRGYGPEQGYDFLRETIIEHDFLPRGVKLFPDEVFISDGAKSDLGNIGDILSKDNRVAVTDPVYPVYIDTNVMGCRAGDLTPDGHWSNLIYIACRAENGFVPELPQERPDVIYLCYPNNPIGTVLSKEELQKWVDYAVHNRVLILFDAAYEAYIQDKDIPHSIYVMEGAKKVAIEFRSFSKTAGFTGVRCGYTVVPRALKGYTIRNEKISMNHLWNRRQSTKFNGTAYIIQRAAEAVFTPQGQKEIKENIAYYMNNAAIIRAGLVEAGFEVYGGTNAPYIWLKTPKNMSSWAFFDKLLRECRVVGTPGVGFGPSGEGYFRLTAFGKKENAIEAIERIRQSKIRV